MYSRQEEEKINLPPLSSMPITLPRADEENLRRAITSIHYDLKNRDENIQENLAIDLLAYPRIHLLRLCQYGDPEIQSLLQEFCRTNPHMKKTFAQRLKGSNNLYQEFTSLNKRERFSSFDLYLATYFTEAAMKSSKAKTVGLSRESCLSYAQALGSPFAMEIAFKRETESIRLKYTTGTEDNISQELKNIHMLSEGLCMRYGSLGYAKTGCRTYVLGQFLIDHGDLGRGLTFCEQAVKHFLCSLQLDNKPESSSIREQLLPEQELKDYYNDFFKEHQLDLSLNANADIPLFCQTLIDKSSFTLAEKAAKLESESLLSPPSQARQASGSMFRAKREDQKTEETRINDLSKNWD